MTDQEHREPIAPPARRRRLRDPEAVVVVVFVAVASLLPIVMTSPYWLGVLATAWIFAMAGSGLNIVAGHLGEVPLAHQGFFALGAYASALIAVHSSIPVPAAVVLGMMFSLGVGAVMGLISFRATGAYFAIATFGFGMLIAVVIDGWSGLTNGVFGFAVPPFKFDLLGTTVDWSAPKAYYYLTLLSLGILMLLLIFLFRSRLGAAARAIRENAGLAAATGINVYRVRVTMFAMSAAAAGVAGAFYAHYIRYISSDLAGLYYLTTFLIIVVVGGSGPVLGPVFGALIFVVVPEELRVSQRLQLFAFSAIVLLIIVISPRGAIPGLAAASHRLRRSLRKEDLAADHAAEHPL